MFINSTITQGKNDVITSVKLHEGVDMLLAVGTASGDITVFCVPGLISVQKKQVRPHSNIDLYLSL